VRTAEGLEGLLLIGWSDPSAVPGGASPRGARRPPFPGRPRPRPVSSGRQPRSRTRAALGGDGRASYRNLPLRWRSLRVVDWNEAERRMLGIQDDSERPHEVERTQGKFDVRFVDGTPLDLENAPVVQACFESSSNTRPSTTAPKTNRPSRSCIMPSRLPGLTGRRSPG
jgi:hypothetical protein